MLDNTQYNEIAERIHARKLDAEVKFQEHREALLRKYPELRMIYSDRSANAVKKAAARINNDFLALRKAEEAEAALNQRENELIEKFSLSGMDLAPVYFCPLCKDTGYLNGEKCRCFRDEELKLLYGASNLSSLVTHENFNSIFFDCYDKTSTDGKPSIYDKMTKIIDYCKHYAKTFSEKNESIIFFGPTGVGKTFLSSCIANEVLKNHSSVLYFSSVTLFELLSKELRDGSESEDARELSQDLISCDLLIIDDLGTELLNSYTNSRLFYIINERLLRQKNTIISTNLSPSQIKERYSERIASRIMTGYTVIPVAGDDLRLKLHH